ncbi:tol-pal system protein YbgF [Neotabrizicola sp. VNH66]|uniref:tol-pal system protein YbgF n=1 Tax=Neotabrizicola sp. VNH66 TaxID=3400918 RepID=UPI003C0DA524
MTRARFLLPFLALGFGLPAGAETLADIRVELGQLAAEFNSLKAEMTTTGASVRMGGSDALARMDTIEAELSRLTARAEEIELRLNRVVSDGTNRIGDIEFRLCEQTPGCDPLSLGQTSVLGGGSAAAAPAAPPAAPAAGSTSTGPELAVAEKADFDRAKEVLGQGDFRRAAELFATYAQSYPGGPLIPEAHYLRGEALASLGSTAESARAYLDSYSSDPQSPFAADSLLKLGQALGQLGQRPEACITLAEVGTQYPGTMAATQAPIAMQGLGCP